MPGVHPAGETRWTPKAKKRRSSGFGTEPASTVTGATIEETIAQSASSAAITEPGIVAYSFYSTTNASGQWLRPGAANALSVPVPFRGSVLGMSFRASTACSGTYTVYFGGTASQAKLTVSALTSTYSTWPKGTYGFAAGTAVDVRASNVATSAVVEVIVYVAQDPTSIL